MALKLTNEWTNETPTTPGIYEVRVDGEEYPCPLAVFRMNGELHCVFAAHNAHPYLLLPMSGQEFRPLVIPTDEGRRSTDKPAQEPTPLGPIGAADKMNFETLLTAGSRDDLALMAARRLSDGKQVALV